jgi:hypothetical protein
MVIWCSIITPLEGWWEMSSISDYKKRVSKYGGIKGAVEKHSRHSISFFFKNSPSYEDVYINNSLEPTGVQIVPDTKVPTVKYILMQPNDKIGIGSMILRNDTDTWICISRDPNVIYDKGQIEECNSMLKWVDSNGIVRSYPTVLYYGSGGDTSTDNVMTLPDGRRKVIVQNNEHTIKIKRDMRFIFGGNVFLVVDSDYVSKAGIVNLNLREDKFNPALDNMELGIADYYGSVIDVPEPTPPNTGYSILIKSTSTIPNEVKKNQSKGYFIEVYNGASLVSGEDVAWELYSDDRTNSTSLALIESQLGTSCTIKNNNSTSGYIQLKATMNSNQTIYSWMRIQMKNIF